MRPYISFFNVSNLTSTMDNFVNHPTFDHMSFMNFRVGGRDCTIQVDPECSFDEYYEFIHEKYMGSSDVIKEVGEAEFKEHELAWLAKSVEMNYFEVSSYEVIEMFINTSSNYKEEVIDAGGLDFERHFTLLNYSPTWGDGGSELVMVYVFSIGYEDHIEYFAAVLADTPKAEDHYRLLYKTLSMLNFNKEIPSVNLESPMYLRTYFQAVEEVEKIGVNTSSAMMLADFNFGILKAESVYRNMVKVSPMLSIADFVPWYPNTSGANTIAQFDLESLQEMEEDSAIEIEYETDFDPDATLFSYISSSESDLDKAKFAVSGMKLYSINTDGIANIGVTRLALSYLSEILSKFREEHSSVWFPLRELDADKLKLMRDYFREHNPIITTSFGEFDTRVIPMAGIIYVIPFVVAYITQMEMGQNDLFPESPDGEFLKLDEELESYAKELIELVRV